MNTQDGIIYSLLDTDLYKITMQNAVVNLFPRAKARFTFINRGKTQFPTGFAERLRREISYLGKLSIRKDEKEFLADTCPFLYPTYIDFLSGYQYNPAEVGVIQRGGDLQIDVEGHWYRTILWEVPLMALVSQIYFEMTGEEISPRIERQKNNVEKGKEFYYNNCKVAEFGTRRRYSLENQQEVVRDLRSVFGSDKFLVGTSNVLIAKEEGLKPIGTHAHEWFMFHAAKYGYKLANKAALDHWVETYRGDLGIALSDTFTTDVFFKAFDTKLAKLFDGVRHDSGDPLEFADKVIAHYESLGVDPYSKSIIFSDGLDTETVLKIHGYCKGRVKAAFGIGTNLTNDVGVKPLNIVIKMTAAKGVNDDWVGTVKLSDTPGKHTGEQRDIDLCKGMLNIQETKETVEA
jgi:nicotinate phosphoribosyltransferase